MGIAKQFGQVSSDATPPTEYSLSEPVAESVPELAPLNGFDAEESPAQNGALEKYSYSGGGSDGGGDGDETALAEEESPSSGVGDGAAQDLFAHLGELRARILYSVCAIAIASCLTWRYGNQISELLARPIRRTLDAHGVGSKLVTLDPTEGFYLYFQISLVAAIILAAPVVLFQMWRFIEPALTRTERRFTIVLVPFSVLLFVFGVALGYLMSPIFFQFFLQFQPPGSTATFSYGKSVALLAKMLLVFGVCFQVPVITIFLNKIGLVSRNFLIEYWRHAVVVIFLIVAIITPTWDPLTLCVCAAPPCVLYVFSIWLVKWL
jgi:sec-independent protein translocase protein TatC